MILQSDIICNTNDQYICIDDNEDDDELDGCPGYLLTVSDEYELKNLFDNTFECKKIDKKKINNKCKHVKIDCDLIYDCCDGKFKCNQCHDENNNHEYGNINKIICINCNTKQTISKTCHTCNIQFSEYYCDKCKIFSENKLSHCDNCNICIDDDDCEHKCDNINDKICSVCIDNIMNNMSIKIMRCGHMLHIDCYKKLIKTSYKCPECMKTIKNMKREFMMIDNKIKHNPIESKIVTIYCNDCNLKSNIKYHDIGLKCSNCDSYNTYKL